MKQDENDFGSREHDAPDRRVAYCERVPEPLPEQIAHTRTVRGSLPQAPMFFQKGRDSRCSHPSQVARALQEAIGDTVVSQNCTTRGSQIPVVPGLHRVPKPEGTLWDIDHGELVRRLSARPPQSAPRRLHSGYKSTVTSGSFMEARSEGSLNLMRDSLRLSGRRPKLEQIGNVTKFTINAARCDRDKKIPNQNNELFSTGIGLR